MNDDSTIQNISDTALWIAAYRAQESDCSDAVFKDPFAKQLAGNRGYNMIATTPHTEAMAFAMVVRTVAIDQLILSAIPKGLDAVVNLGAGLDTRPYRLPLPNNLNWIEVDLPNIINYKENILHNYTPNCKLQRISVDLTIDQKRKDFFSHLSYQYSTILIITEGLIGYLSNDQVNNLSKDLFDTDGVKFWIMDYAQGRFRKRKQTKDLKKILTHTPIQFDCDDPISFFKKTCWNLAENLFILDVADKIGRNLPPMFPWNLLIKLFPKKLRSIANQTYGYVMFEK